METAVAPQGFVEHAYVPRVPLPPIFSQQTWRPAHVFAPHEIPVPTQLEPTHEAQRCVAVSQDRPDAQSVSCVHWTHAFEAGSQTRFVVVEQSPFWLHCPQ